MYGNFKMKADVEEEKAAKLAKLNRMKKIYLPPRLSPSKFTFNLSCRSVAVRENLSGQAVKLK